MSQNHTQISTGNIGTKPYEELQNRYANPELANLTQNYPEETPDSVTVAEAIVQMLETLGVKSAYGVAGGAMATLWGALSNSSLKVLNCRHESGATFAAIEAYFASNKPTVVFTTAGPGITNALTGLLAARGEGAKTILLSACTSAPQRGKWAIQETSTNTLPSGGIFTPGVLFNYATTIECAAQLPQIFRKLALGLSQPGGYVAHLSIPTSVQTSLLDEVKLPNLEASCSTMTASGEAIALAAQLLQKGPFAIWVGFGARDAAAQILELAERTGAAVMCSPRGKGIFPENHPQFVGVTGLGGHSSVMKYIQEQPPLHTLVLGTRLGEPTSFWNVAMVPTGGFIHVDIDPEVPGVAYPHAQTYGIQSEIKTFVQALLLHLPKLSSKINLPHRQQLIAEAPEPVLEAEALSEIKSFVQQLVANLPDSTKITLPHPQQEVLTEAPDYLVRPEALMEVIQELIVSGSDAIVLAECGNSFTWSTHMLRFDQANRYRVSTGVGSMGHAVTGVIGAAQAKKKAVSIGGDGAMLMNNEISTAVKYKVPAVWIVLNDARYNMCHQGMKMLGLVGADATIPETDFVAIARAMGADGIRVEKESELRGAIEKAMTTDLPFVVDVMIDPDRPAPSGGRNKGLASLGVKSTAAKKTTAHVSFPNVS